LRSSGEIFPTANFWFSRALSVDKLS